MKTIHDAAATGNVEALRRELERGVSPDTPGEYGTTPLYLAAVNKRTDCVGLLLRAGADPNSYTDPRSTIVTLHQAAYEGSRPSREIVRMLLEAGAAVDVKAPPPGGLTAMDYAYTSRRFAAICPLLLRAGSELPKKRPHQPLSEDPYMSRILSAGGFKKYERAHLEALTKTLSPKLTHLLPPELVRKIVEFYLHAGFYPFTAAKAPAPTSAPAPAA